MVVSSFAGSWSGLLGHPLDGEEVTRFAFLDDAGVDTKEPRFVVAGFVMHRDRQSAVIEDELYALATQVRPDKPNVVLSAKNIWSGTKEFDEDKHKLGMDRKALLLELAEMPRKFSLPVAFGHCVKATCTRSNTFAIPAEPTCGSPKSRGRMLYLSLRAPNTLKDG
jgi:hypothetical protein